MSFRLIKTSALSGVPEGYAIDGRDYVHVSVGAAPGTPSALSSVKATFDQIANSVYSNKCNTGWLSSGIDDGRRMYIDGVVGITTDMPTFSAAGGREKLTVEGNTKITGALSATGGAYNYLANRLGIGTSTPGTELEVGDGTGSEAITINKSTGGTGTLYFDNAGSNKVYFQADADEHLRIATNNSVVMSILESGNVGIGTTAPNNPLTVIGMISGTNDAAFGSKHAANGTVSISGTDAILIPVGTTGQRPAASQVGHIRYNETIFSYEGYSQGAWSSLGGVIDKDKDTKILSESSVGADEDHLMFYAGGTKYMQLNNSGYLGIGSDIDATYAIQVEHSSPVLNLKATNEGGTCQIYFMTDQADDNHDHRTIKAEADGDLHFSSYNSGSWVDQLTIKADGKVGIGDTDPSVELDVTGSANVTGTLNVDGTATASRFISDVSVGTAPLTVTSTTNVSNLNADYWDGYHFADFINQQMRSVDFPTWKGVHVTGEYEGAHWTSYLTMTLNGAQAGGGFNRNRDATGIRQQGGQMQVKSYATMEPWYTLSPSSPGSKADFIGWSAIVHTGYTALCYATIGKTQTDNTAVDHQSASCSIVRYHTGSYQIIPDRKMSGTQAVFTQLSWPSKGNSNKQRSPLNMTVDHEERTDYVTVHRYVYTWSEDVGFGDGFVNDVDVTYTSNLVDIAGGGYSAGQRGFVVIYDSVINMRSAY